MRIFRLAIAALVAIAPLLSGRAVLYADPSKTSLVDETFKIVDPAGNPVAGATVWLRRSLGPMAPVTLTTDDRGMASASLAPSPFVGGYADRIVAYAPGRALAGATVGSGVTTVTLPDSVPIRGVTTDSAGKAVGGVRLRLAGQHTGDWRENVLAPDDAAGPETVSAADGSFTLPGGEANWTAQVEVRDPRFVAISADAMVNADSTLTIPVRIGCVVEGRLLYAGGAPATSITVFARSMKADGLEVRALTGSDGRYRLTGLAEGKAWIAVDREQSVHDSVAAALQNIDVAPGRTTTAPDIVMTHGALVTGTVTDDAGAPVSLVAVGAFGPERPQGIAGWVIAFTDRSGKYQIRAAPGESRIFVLGGGSPEGFLATASEKTLTLAEGDARTVDLQVVRGNSLNGRAVDEQGAGIGGVTLQIAPPGSADSPEQVVTGDDGSFHVSGLPARSLQVQTSNEWEIVSGRDLQMPPSGAPPALRLVLRRVALAPIAGEARTQAGAPIGSVQVVAIVLPHGASSMMKTDETETDAEGRYFLWEMPAGQQVVVTFLKSGYRYLSGGKVAAVGGKYTTTPAILSKLDASISGKALDPWGRPAAGALVTSPDLDTAAFVKADAHGAFVLSGLAEGAATVMASLRSQFGESEFKPGEEAVIRLQAPGPKAAADDASLAMALLQDAISGSEGSHYYARGALAVPLAQKDPDGAYALARQIDEAGGYGARSAVILAVAGQDGAASEAWVNRHLSEIGDGPVRRMILVQIGLKSAAGRPETARRCYDQAVASIGDPALAHWEELVSLIWLGARLGAPDADRFYDVALAKAKATPVREGYEDSLHGFVRLVGAASPAIAQKALGELPAAERPNIAAGIADLTAQSDPELALKLIADSAAPSYARGRAAATAVERLAPTDSDEALRVAEGVDDRVHKGVALAIAAGYRPAAERPALFEKAFESAASAPGNRGEGAWIAAMAYQSDPAIGKELFEKLRDQMTGPIDGRSDISFAFYTAALWPDEARLRIERAFARTKSAPDVSEWSAVPCILAMAALDPQRARDMAESVKGEPRFDSERKLAQYLLASDIVRKTLRFDRWCASDTWTPGTPADW